MVEWAPRPKGVGYAELAEVVADDLVESVEDTRPPTGSYDPCDYPSMNPDVDPLADRTGTTDGARTEHAPHQRA
jgi:hypothetical protein